MDFVFEEPGHSGGCGCGGDCSGSPSKAGEDRIVTYLDDSTVFAAWTTNTFLPSTAWIPAGRVKRVRAHWELRDRTGNLQLAPGFRVANTDDAPGAFKNLPCCVWANQVDCGLCIFPACARISPVATGLAIATPRPTRAGRESATSVAITIGPRAGR